MKASQFVIKAVQETVNAADRNREVGGMLSVNSSLVILRNRWGDMSNVSLETFLDALNQLSPSAMREEIILLLEGMLALREINAMKDDKPACTKQTKAKACRHCLGWNELDAFVCANCGYLMDL